MYIYNRWGDLIYQTFDVGMPWNGKANNGAKEAPEDVYVWVIYLRDYKEMKHEYYGHVTLIR